MHPRVVPEVTAVDMTEAECWEHLARLDFGRLAVTDHGAPAIYPVGYSVVPGGILISARGGSRLLSVLLSGDVAFEADARTDVEGWSVLLKGVAQRIDRTSLKAVGGVAAHADGDAHVLVLITPTELTGRVLHRG